MAIDSTIDSAATSMYASGRLLPDDAKIVRYDANQWSTDVIFRIYGVHHKILGDLKIMVYAIKSDDFFI